MVQSAPEFMQPSRKAIIRMVHSIVVWHNTHTDRISCTLAYVHIVVYFILTIKFA